MTKENHTNRKLAIGATIAGAIGYIAGVLTAPKSGKETRQDITDMAEGLKDSAEHQLVYAQAELKDALKMAKSKSLALSAQAREEFNEAVVKAKDAQNKTAAVLKAFRAGKADDPQLNKAVRQANQALKNLKKFLKK